MPSQLTRHVFRRLLANEPIVHRGCLRRNTLLRATAPAVTSFRAAEIPTAGCQQCRTFFDLNMFRAKGRDKKPAEMEPGIPKMMELARKQNMRARLPTTESVYDAIKAFFLQRNKASINDTQAALALRSLKYVMENTSAEDMPFSGSDVMRIATLVSKDPVKLSDAHVELVKIACDISLSRKPNAATSRMLEKYCMILSNAGRPGEARKVLLQYYPNSKAESANRSKEPSEIEEIIDEDAPYEAIETGDKHMLYPADACRVWRYILVGFANLNKAADVRRTLQDIENRKVNVFGIEKAMLDFSVAQSQFPEIERYWNQYWTKAAVKLNDPKYPKYDYEPLGKSIDGLLKWCVRNDKVDFGHGVVRQVMSTNPPKPVWDSIFVWAASTGKGIDEIGRMLDVMEKSNKKIADENWWRIPDIATINSLVEFAISQKDPYMAERFISLGRDRNILPDARTFVLQMEYRLSVNDVDGALTAYKNLQAQDVSMQEDVPVVNRLLIALCGSQRHDFDTIMNVAADLTDRGARFEPLTVATLSALHLSRDEVADVVDLLNTHANKFSSDERAIVSDALTAYCMDSSVDTTRSWETYSIIRETFDEIPREPRTKMMSNFFQRYRSDMAVHAFNHMRAHSRADTIPIDATYITAFLGAAKQRDLESLEVLHNQLKLDYNVDISTRVRNSLLISYTACGEARQALGFWDEMCASAEGPSYESIHAALRACEKSSYGDLKAQKIWDKLRKMKIDLDRDLWASYAAALVGNGDVGLAIRTLEEAETHHEVELDAFVVGSLFMAASGKFKQTEIEKWIKQRSPEIWEDLEQTGVEEAENGTRTFGIDRSVTP